VEPSQILLLQYPIYPVEAAVAEEMWEAAFCAAFHISSAKPQGSAHLCPISVDSIEHPEIGIEETRPE